jgi:hypothetical protein
MSSAHTLSAPSVTRARRLSNAHELPAELPDGEHVLWQGAPAWWPLARSLHLRLVAGYFAVLVLWYAADRYGRGATALDVARVAGLSAAVVALFAIYAFLVSRTTSYTLTNHRIVLQTGVALPISLNIPFTRIAGVDLRRNTDASGDIVLTLDGDKRPGFAVLWPHVRPWRFARPQPMLRAIPKVDRVAKALTQRLETAEPSFIRRAPDAETQPYAGQSYPDQITAAA